MRIKNLTTNIVVALAALYLTAVVVYAVTTTLVVFPGNLEGWQLRTAPGSQPTPAATPSVTFVFGPGTPPLGRGSAEFHVGSDGDANAELRQPNFALTALPNPSPTPAAANELTALSYSTYAQSGGSGGQTPYLILNIDTDNDGDVDDLLFFEPVYQNGTYTTVDPSITIPNQCGSNPLCVSPGQWQTWDAFNGGWWSLNAGTFGPPLTTLKFYRSQNPLARIVNSSTGNGGVRIVTGGGAGAWDNFIGNADAFTIGVGPDTTIYDFEPTAPPTPATGGVIISELRTSGPAGDDDEYIELYNTSNTEIAVQAADSSGGWALVKRGADCTDAPIVIATIPNGTTIPARGHYLVANTTPVTGYSLCCYPAGHNNAGAPTTSTPDLSLSAPIQNNRNVGLFNSATTFDLAHRLDAVGFDAGSGTTCDLLTEGTKLLAPRGSTAEHAFVRKQGAGGFPVDTGNNAADFATVSTRPDLHGGVGDNPTPILGAPGPENRTSPVNRNAQIGAAPIAPSLPSTQSPNRQRDFNIQQCSAQGSLFFRHTFTNNTTGNVTRLRFRVMDITTLNSPGYTNSTQADLRIRNSQDETLFVPGRGTVLVHGLTREQPPGQGVLCGGLNTSLSDDTITFASPLAPGASVDVVFRAGIERKGSFRLLFSIEALP